MHTATCKFVVVSACTGLVSTVIETMPACNQSKYLAYVMEAHFMLFSLLQLQLLLIIGSIEGYSMKLMPELESLRCIYPKKCLCALLYAACPNFRLR